MDRGTLAAYITAEYDALLAVAYPSDDPAFNLEGPIYLVENAISNALRLLGVPEAQQALPVIADSQVGDIYALCDYYALRALARKLATFADVTIDMPKLQKMRSQIAAQATLLLQDAEAEIAQRGYGKNAMQIGRLQLDFLEPTYGYGYGGALLSPEGEW